ncbi:MAG: apolipoprotein N-acyltransferase, partial [bacterium]
MKLKKPSLFIEQSISTFRRRLYSVIFAGFLLGLAYPPWGLWFLIIPAFALLYIALSGVETRFSFLKLGFIFGFVFYLVHCYWLVSFHPLALPAALVYIALWIMLWAFIASYLNKNPFYYAASWIFMEWLLGLGYFAFPWSRIATALAAQPLLIQPVAFSGELFWGGLWVLCGLLLGAVLLNYYTYKYLLAVIILLTLFFAGGVYRSNEVELEFYETPALIIQHNVSSFPIRIGVFENQYENLVSITERRADRGQLIIWPETSIGISFGIDLSGKPSWPSEEWKEKLLALIPSRSALLSGVIFYEPHPTKLDVLNGAVLLDSRRDIAGYYTKRKPVPVGEHLPLMGRWKWVYNLGRLLGTHGYRPGDRGGLIEFESDTESIKIAVQICFEDAFPSYVRGQVLNGADLLVNISNDSWSRSRASHR